MNRSGRGERMPPGPLRPETLYYRHSVRFAEQLERYFEAFGRERVHVIVFDDFRDDTGGTYREVLEFLDVDPTFTPRFEVRNPNKRVRSRFLQRLIYQPPGPVLRAVPKLRRFPVVRRAREAMLHLNSAAARRPEMDPQLRARLSTELAPEVEALGRLISRDLSAWSVAPSDA
ncbi:MAG TPA: hypothetical protein VF114_06445 [Candidatus Limnocylindria bacterium]